MSVVDTFKVVRNEMREFLLKKLVKYLNCIDDAEFDKANDIRQLILPYSHMFYVGYKCELSSPWMKYDTFYDWYDWYDVIKQHDKQGVTRLDEFMERKWKEVTYNLHKIDEDHTNKYIVI